MIRAIYDASMLGALSVACWGLDQVQAGVRALERFTAQSESRKGEGEETSPQATPRARPQRRRAAESAI